MLAEVLTPRGYGLEPSEGFGDLHLRREAPDLMAAQIGRARGDLKYRLSEATRRLARTVEGRYADAAGRMRQALRATEEIGAGSAAEAAEREDLLSERIAATRHALALLDAVHSVLTGMPWCGGSAGAR